MRETTTASWLGRSRLGPGTRKASRGPAPVRVLAAGPGVEGRLAALGARLAGAVVISAADVPAAVESILLRHPSVVVVDGEIGGHELGGLRLVVDCVSLGVPVVVLGAVPASRGRRLAELEVARVPREAGAPELWAAIERAVTLGPRPPRAAAAPAHDAAAASKATTTTPSPV